MCILITYLWSEVCSLYHFLFLQLYSNIKFHETIFNLVPQVVDEYHPISTCTLPGCQGSWGGPGLESADWRGKRNGTWGPGQLFGEISWRLVLEYTVNQQLFSKLNVSTISSFSYCSLLFFFTIEKCKIDLKRKPGVSPRDIRFPNKSPFVLN